MWDLFLEFIKIGGLPFALVALAMLAIIRGDIVTRRSHEAVLVEMEKLLAEKDKANLRERERVAELWEIVLPSLQVGRGALDRLEREQHPRREPRATKS